MCACTTSVIVLSPRVEFSAVAVYIAVFAVAWAKKKNQKNQKKMNNLEIL